MGGYNVPQSADLFVPPYRLAANKGGMKDILARPTALGISY
ncbi:MAG TPA: hypothetical protein VIL24_02430 [Clostridia bacterium]